MAMIVYQRVGELDGCTPQKTNAYGNHYSWGSSISQKEQETWHRKFLKYDSVADFLWFVLNLYVFWYQQGAAKYATYLLKNLLNGSLLFKII